MVRTTRMNTEINPSTWSLTFALLTACICVLMGVYVGQRPDVIVYRATLSSVVIGVAFRGLGAVLQHQLKELDDD